MFKNKHLLLLHFIVLIWGFSPILGKVISVQALQLVWFRIGITLIAICIYLLFTKQNMRVSGKDLLKLLGIGTVIAFHWFCFYNAIKISNISITLVAFATATLFTAIIEPLFYRRKIIRYEIAFGMVIIAAIAMILKVETEYKWGIVFGMTAALTSSFFTVCNGLMVQRIPSPVISAYELAGGFIALSIYLLCKGNFSAEFFIISNADWGWLLLFSVVGTAFPFISSVNLMRYISPYTVTLTTNLETVYGIVLASIFWRKTEAMTPVFYIGTFVIFCTIFGNAALKNYLKKE